MAIKKITLKNFKSFRAVSVDLSNFTVVIGANASGKSNLVQAFRFVRDIAQYGLASAVSLQGGMEYLTNFAIRNSEPFFLEISADVEMGSLITESSGRPFGILTRDITYHFALETKGNAFNILEDVATLTLDVTEFELARGEHSRFPRATSSIGQAKLTISSESGAVTTAGIFPPNSPFREDAIVPPYLREEQIPAGTLLLQLHTFPLDFFSHAFQGNAVYDFDPRLSRKTAVFTGKADLEEDGSNLAIILRRVLEDPEARRKLVNLTSELLPFVRDVEIAKYADRFLFLHLDEAYTSPNRIPASLLSDGTIGVAALLVALYFENTHAAIIEEPDRHLHPSLMASLTQLMSATCSPKTGPHGMRVWSARMPAGRTRDASQAIQ